MTTPEITEAIENLKDLTERLQGLLPENNMFAKADQKVANHIAAELPKTLARQLDAIDHESKRLRNLLSA